MDSIAESDQPPVRLAGSRRRVLLTLVILGFFALMLALVMGIGPGPKSLSTEQYIALGYYPLDQPIKVEIDSLLTHRETPFLADDLTGHWSLLFFGYSYCPDICPTTLAVLNHVAQELSAPDSPAAPQVIMVTVDPGRDSAAQLADYVPYFNSEFIGITGELDALMGLATQLNVAFEKVPAANSDTAAATGADSFAVAHGTQIVVVNPQGYYTGLLTTPHQAERIVKVLTSLMRE